MMKKRLLVVGILLLTLVMAFPAYAQDFTIAMVVKVQEPVLRGLPPRRRGSCCRARLQLHFPSPCNTNF